LSVNGPPSTEKTETAERLKVENPLYAAKTTLSVNGPPSTEKTETVEKEHC